MSTVVGGANGTTWNVAAYPDGSVTARMTRSRHTMLVPDATSVTLWYAHAAQFENRYHSGVAPTETLTVRVAVEVVGAGTSSNTPGTLSAVSELVLTPGQLDSVTIPLPATVAEGQFFYVRTYATAPLAGGQCQIPRGATLSPTMHEQYESNGSDLTGGGTITSAPSGGRGFSPNRIDVTSSTASDTAVGLIGDSLNQNRDYFVQDALDTASTPRVSVALGGDSMTSFLSDQRVTRLALLNGCDAVICAYGANDLGTSTPLTSLSIMANRFLQGWALLGGPGRPVWQTTTTPRTTSSDGWGTAEGQTPVTSTSLRHALNAWFRAGAPTVGGTYAAVGTPDALTAGYEGHPLRGFLEIADTVETSRDSGLWKYPSYTADGLHMTATGDTAAAAGVDVATVLASIGVDPLPVDPGTDPPPDPVLIPSGFRVSGQSRSGYFRLNGVNRQVHYRLDGITR